MTSGDRSHYRALAGGVAAIVVTSVVVASLASLATATGALGSRPVAAQSTTGGPTIAAGHDASVAVQPDLGVEQPGLGRSDVHRSAVESLTVPLRDAGRPGLDDSVRAVEDPATDTTVTSISVLPNGTARWRLTVRTRLPTNESLTTYEAFQEQFRENRSTYRQQFRGPMVRVVAAASNATGRSMVATNFTATTSVQTVPRRWGVVTYSFRWEKFAYREGDTLHVGDAFESDFFITRNDTLVLQAPEDYEFGAVHPQPDDSGSRTATWVGRVDFGVGEPAARIRPATASEDDDAAGEAGRDGGDADNGSFAALDVVIALVVSALAAGGGLVWYRRRDDRSPAPATDPAQNHASRTRDGVSPPADGAETTADPDTPRARSDPPVPLTDDEHVRQIVTDHGGRMRQADIVAEVEWSKSKVSRILSDLAAEGAVEKTRIGRENVISLSDPDAVESNPGADGSDPGGDESDAADD